MIRSVVGPFMPDEEKLAAIRELLPATAAGIYLNTAEAGPIPSETAHAMAEAADWELRTGRAHEAHREQQAQRLDEARGALAAILHAGIDAVAIAHSASGALSAYLSATEWRGGGRIAVATDLLGDVVAPRGVEVVPMPGWTIPDGVRVAVVSHVAPSGRVAPLATLVAQAHAAGTALAVDGSFAAGVVPVDVATLGVDAYATDAHRWLLGPTGMAAIVIEGPERSAVRTTLEAHPFHGPSVLGMARSAGWLAMYVGLDWVTDRTVTLARRLADRLAAIEHVEVFTPRPVEAGILEFRLDRWPDELAHEELERRAFAILGQVSGGHLASVGAWNTEAELDRFAEVVTLLAANTPETLPRRPSLSILHGR